MGFLLLMGDASRKVIDINDKIRQQQLLFLVINEKLGKRVKPEALKR